MKNWFLVSCLIVLPIIALPVTAGNEIVFSLPSDVEVISPTNISKVTQLAIIAPTGVDLAGSDNQDLQLFAEKPSGPEHWITSVSFSADGQYLAAGSYDTSVRIWNLRTGHQTQTLIGHQEMVNDVTFSPDSEMVVSVSGAYEWYRDFTIRLWNAASGAPLGILTGHRDEVLSIAFSPDGALLATASFDGTVRLWSVEQALDPTRATTAMMRTIRANQGWVYSANFSPSGDFVVSAGDDNFVKIWQVKTGNFVRSMSHDDRVYDAVYSPDGRYIASVSLDRSIRIWDADSGELFQSWVVSNSEDVYPYTIAYSPSGELLAVGVDKLVHIWNIRTGEELASLAGHTRAVWDLAFTSDGTLLASAGNDGTIRLWGVPNTES